MASPSKLKCSVDTQFASDASQRGETSSGCFCDRASLNRLRPMAAVL